MEKRILGKTGEEVSILGFGCMRLPVLDPNRQSGIDIDLATAMVRKAIDRGVNYIDTAYPYHRDGDMSTPGASEPFLAHALKDGYREKVKIATKLPSWFMESEAQMHSILDQQLKRLNTKQIDFYLAHNLNLSTWSRVRDAGLLPFLAQAQKDGRIKHVGFSFHDTYQLFEEIMDSYDWAFCQIQHNYLDVDFQAGAKGLQRAASRGMGVVIMEPLRGGYLVNHMPAEQKEELAKIRPEWSLADWAFRWLWSRKEVGVVLSGMSTMEQVEENLDIADKAAPLTRQEEEALKRVREAILANTKVNCTACGYCLPCPQGVNIPKVFQFYNLHSRFTDPNSRFQSRVGYAFQVKDEERANRCIACGACEPKCPQGIHITGEMQEAARALHAE